MGVMGKQGWGGKGGMGKEGCKGRDGKAGMVFCHNSTNQEKISIIPKKICSTFFAPGDTSLVTSVGLHSTIYPSIVLQYITILRFKT